MDYPETTQTETKPVDNVPVAAKARRPMQRTIKERPEAQPTNVAGLSDYMLRKLMWMKRSQLPHEFNRAKAVAYLSKLDALDLTRLIVINQL